MMELLTSSKCGTYLLLLISPRLVSQTTLSLSSCSNYGLLLIGVNS